MILVDASRRPPGPFRHVIRAVARGTGRRHGTPLRRTSAAVSRGTSLILKVLRAGGCARISCSGALALAKDLSGRCGCGWAGRLGSVRGQRSAR